MTNTKTGRKQELLIRASKLSIAELDQIINECLDKKEYEDAKIFAEIYNRRVAR